MTCYHCAGTVYNSVHCSQVLQKNYVMGSDSIGVMSDEDDVIKTTLKGSFQPSRQGVRRQSSLAGVVRRAHAHNEAIYDLRADGPIKLTPAFNRLRSHT